MPPWTGRFHVGEPVWAPMKTGPEQTVTYHAGTIVGAHYTRVEPVYDVHIPDLYPPGSWGYGDPWASVPLDESALQGIAERRPLMGQIKIIAGSTPKTQKVADQLAEAMQQKYGKPAHTPDNQAPAAKHPETEYEAGD